MQVERRVLALISVLIALQVSKASGQPLPSGRAQSAVCVYSGPATNLPLVGPIGNQSLDWTALSSPVYIHIIGCGGGGGGAGAGKAPQDGYGVSGGGGAGADVRTYTYGPIAASTVLKVTFSAENGAGGCGGGRDASECAQIPPGHRVYPDPGGPGADGMTVKIGSFTFEGGEGARAMDNGSGRSLGGRKAYAGGDGAAMNIGDAESGKDYKNKHKGGTPGPSGNGPGGQGGLRGSGGGASPAGDGGRGGRAGSGNGHSDGAANNAKAGENGGICAGGGGGGAAAGGQFPGGNGGDGGPAWVVIYASSTLSPITKPELETLGQVCGNP